MKVGRELDVKIGDEFFDMVFWYGDPTGYRIEENTDYWIVGSENSYGELSKRCPFFSTQIAAAKQVLNKMIGNGYAVEIMHDCVAWSVCFVHLDTGTKHRADWKNSLEAQICLAALDACEVDYETV